MDDSLSRDKRAALPQGHAKLRTLSPAFISADDVARYLHERIGTRQQTEYGSVILQRRSDQLYVGTEPLADRPTTFEYTLLLDRVSADGEYRQPDGYTLVATLHSHPDTQALTQKQNPRFTAQQVKAFMSFYSTPDVILTQQNRLTLPYAYLCGPDGTLLRYQVSYSEDEAQYVRWLSENGPWSSPHAHDGSLEGVFKKLASVGTLRFLRSSPTWGGSVGDVPADWQPYQPFNAAPLPIPCGPVFASQEQALAYAWTRIQRQPTVRQQVLLLQHSVKGLYIAAEPQPPGQLKQLPTLPEGFHLHGVYVHSRPLPGNYPELEAWLYKNFISPLELAQYITQFRGYALAPSSTLGASLFIRLRDEALLRYRFSGSADESLLFTTEADGTVRDQGLQAQLANGALLTRDYVLRVARAGELSVEKTSALWDRLGVVDAHWRPYSNRTVTPLTRAFLSADDAARHAHLHIDEQREHAYGGLILQRSDGRFVATDPVRAQGSPFTLDGGYPKDRQGGLIVLHAGHRLHARYGSRQALSKNDRTQGSRLKWSHQEAELHGQMFSDLDIQAILQSNCPGYLSGTQDSLIAFQPGEATSAWRQQWQATATGGVSPIAGRLDSGAIKPADIVRILAEPGTLRVMTASALWGPAEKVETDWAPFVRAVEFHRPDELSYGALFDSADAAALDLQSRQPERAHPRYANTFFAFIFKHQAREEYVASEWVPATQKTPLLSLPGVSDNPVPEGFACQGVYFTRQTAGRGPNAWLERLLILPDDLSTAIIQGRTAVPSSLGAPTIYIAPPEGALLSFRSSSTDSLFEAGSNGDSVEQIMAKLSFGTLSPLGFVHQVAAAGDLRVIATSPCWDRLGAVAGTWEAYAHLTRRRMSAAFLSMDDAARYVHRRVPLGGGKSYGGAILRRDDGWFIASEPLPLADEVFGRDWLFPDELVARGLYPERCTLVAYYHSRPSRALPFLLTREQATVYGNMFSTRLLAHAMGEGHKGITHYSLGQDGSLIRLLATARVKYPPITQANLIMRAHNRRDWLYGQTERALRSAELTPVEYVNRVAASFSLDVVQGGALWGVQGPVSGWVPYATPQGAEPNYTRARQDPAFGPVCTQLDDAARSLSSTLTTCDELQLGYLLKSQDGHFVATLPIKDSGARFAHRRVFSDAGYPRGYTMAGLYFCVSQPIELSPRGTFIGGDEIYQGLFSPYDLKDALYQVSATRTRGSLPLYIFCADGALLKYVVVDPRFVQYRDHSDLHVRVLSPRDFIRRMAAAGDLRILRSSTNWPGLGRVDSQWQPGRSQGMPELDDHTLSLGPVYLHAEDAALHTHTLAGQFAGKQYLGALLENTQGSDYLPVVPALDQGYPSAVAERLFPEAFKGIGPARMAPQLPADYRFCAAHLVFHSGLDQPERAGEDAYRMTFVSWREVGFYLHTLKSAGVAVNALYLSTRDGALLGYLPSFSNEEYNLLDSHLKWSKADGYTAYAPAPSHVVFELARLGELRVIHPSAFWRVRGKLGADLAATVGERVLVPTKDEL
ncbi:DUF4329 domain-containing protein [Pseudomonas sp. MWU13-2517]|uniref:DUF4329 domain-containing protein n=1 Tax=Pseudomonas sp. MWU13-2517 TaxID=2929055 RepID=UPI002010A7C6|nr:DUF4329 domain-containing protein [Pseudomonas sp. MWU13-2517]